MRRNRQVDRAPLAPGAVPVLGHALRLLRDPLPWLDACRQTGPLVRVRMGPRSAHLVCCPHLVHELLMNRSFDKGGPLFDNARELLGNGLGTSTREDHLRQRRLMQPAFSPSHIAAYAAVMREEIAGLTDSWKGDGAVDLFPDLMSLTMRVLIRTLLPTADPQEAEHLSTQIRFLMAGLLFRIAVPSQVLRQLPVPGNRRFNRARAEAFAGAERIVAAARAHPERGGLLAALMDTGAAEDGFTDEDLRDQVMTMFVGGTESTATTVAWLFHLLTLHPQVEERLHAELDAVLAGRVATAEDLPRLPFTRNVLQETLRLYPVGWLLTRVSVTDVEFGGHRFPAGADFLFSSYLLHHDPASFPAPERFDPDRWDTPLSGDARHAHIPFSTGRRKCIGDTFALTEATIILSAIAAHWRLRPAPGSRVRPHIGAALAPRGLRLVTEPRTPTRRG
ncbi:cytochrome P450 [Allokutzneria multivorans]|uniref:Cytochrome P450 n=1 Tax=Allokutzneria multivorans TaxID=1142134 RepID=A0ABP7QXG3_9PSEU